MLIAQGEHPKGTADRLGHSSVRTVLDVYGHFYEGADEAAAERLDEQITSYARPRYSRPDVESDKAEQYRGFSVGVDGFEPPASSL